MHIVVNGNSIDTSKEYCPFWNFEKGGICQVSKKECQRGVDGSDPPEDCILRKYPATVRLVGEEEKCGENDKKWTYTRSWNGKVETVECKKHSYAWSGKTPCTGIRKCIYCGRPEEKH